MNPDAALLRLAHGRLSPRRVDRLLEKHGTPASAVRAIIGGGTGGIDVRDAVVVPAAERRAELESAGIDFVLAGEAGFPARLARYPDSPRWLFTRGTVDLGHPTIAIVGSRASTTYGLELAFAYGVAAARQGWVVVSGLARGIDGAAHRGALHGDGGAIGVLGCGIDVAYPREHALLIDDVADRGLLLSEYPPGTRPDAWRFPTRNRIIAGLADVVLVVEASERGGALITARVALDYGIPVYAVPGDIDRVTSRGCNALIRDGAFPILGADDLREVLGLVETTLPHR